jgi:hypothetical protein
MTRRIPTWLVILGLIGALPAIGQQTGSISGRVTMPDGSALPGVVVEASSTVLPRARVATTGPNGNFTLPQLPPGTYRLTFSLAGMESVSREIQVSLQQEAIVNAVMAPEAVAEEITVLGESPLIDLTSAEIKSGVDNATIAHLPIGQEYRDLVKLIPGVQYTQDQVRGPSAGGSGQDNIYQFDGVNVNLPLFGTLSAEPSSHDIDQISVVKGGARARDFNRSGGFLIDSVSKSGTSQFKGEASFRLQTSSMTSSQKAEQTAQFDEDRDWLTLNLGGPILQDQLFFYGSYYRPTRERDNRANAYGEVPDFEETRDEFFGKLTFSPTGSLLLHGSYRDSDREQKNASVGAFSTPSTARGEAATLRIAIGAGSWVLSERSFATFKVTDFENKTSGRPDRLLSVQPSLAPGARLDIGNLDQMGHFFVPRPIAGQDAFNAFIQPLIDRYGFLVNGVPTGGGAVGADNLINDQDFFRQSFQLAYDFSFGDRVSHELHVGYQWFEDEERLERVSNGWGIITVPGGRSNFQGQPVFYEARLFAGAAGAIPVGDVRTSYESHNIEVNDTIRWQRWTFNVGAQISQDTLYGQGLRKSNETVSGFVPAPGNKYEMYKIDWDELIQPRLSANWAYNGRDTVYASYAKYNPAASSLPRAAAWDRNFFLRTIDAFFDAEGNLIGTSQVLGSSGKLFADGLKPRYVDEYLIGTSKQIAPGWAGRAFGRYRRAGRFWEDTNNNARVNFEPPPGIPRELYIPPNDLVGTGSYVIAQLDGAFTKFYEVSLETDYRRGPVFVRGSYVWSQYYGNFDQDNTTLGNDANIFVGSSFIADAAGRQIWDNRYGYLRGDRRHQLKLYGHYELPWNAMAGAFAIYQDGQPWEMWDYQPYSHLTTSTSSTSRFAEPAGSRRTSDHYQLDLKYTQNFPFGGRYTVQLIGELFNVFDKQTGYNVQPVVHSAGFGEPRTYFHPRQFVTALRFMF